MKTTFPYDGELFSSPKKKYEETIFFVHFFDGNKRQLLRHIRAVNAIGFDAFAFTLPLHWNVVTPPISRSLDLGWKHLYADVIEELLNLLPGPKIIFSFSNPSASAIEAMSRRSCIDTRALVCDSGPTAHFLKSAKNLAAQYLLEKEFVKAALMTASPIFWTPKVHNDIKNQLKKFPHKFPVLSIYGGKDPLIPPGDIIKVFKPHPHLQWQKLLLPQAAHLNGLRDFRNEYLEALKSFLQTVAVPISS